VWRDFHLAVFLCCLTTCCLQHLQHAVEAPSKRTRCHRVWINSHGIFECRIQITRAPASSSGALNVSVVVVNLIMPTQFHRPLIVFLVHDSPVAVRRLNFID